MVVGTTIVRQDAAELLHAATVAVVGRLPLEWLRHAVPSFLTLSEVSGCDCSSSSAGESVHRAGQ